ncbi:hypothetical protein CLH62_11305 [Marinobacter guineae]|uniref:Uncharacterized protein n=1 Tax=Marinobacter guineae TaxID=432303 RepID=A0A2G1VEI6_9GAMM|nr:hypothetical protein CLH62_11305 [Marinobacter guineae]
MADQNDRRVTIVHCEALRGRFKSAKELGYRLRLICVIKIEVTEAKAFECRDTAFQDDVE